MHDIVVFGATGHTAGFIIQEIASSKTLRPGFSWAIAGRNGNALKLIQTSLKGKHTLSPDVVVADIAQEMLLVEMARQAKVVINCVGPFRLVGEAVVKACVEGGANYLDIAGEPEFIERMHLKYHDQAVKAGVTILHAAAFDSVPCDLGVLEIKRAFMAAGAIPSSIEMFFSLNTTGKYGVHSTTFDSAIHGFGKGHAELAVIRKELAKIRPTPQPAGPPPARPQPGRFGIMRDPRVKGYLIPYFVADPAVVNMSQYIELLLEDKNSSQSSSSPRPPPVHFAAYMVLPSLYTFLVFTLYFAVFKWMVARPWGRELMLKHPKLFTKGIASKEGPSAEQRAQETFSQTFYSRGYSSDITAHKTPLQDPNMAMTARIDGGEVGYVVTPLIIVKCALAMARLDAAGGIRRGVLTSAVVFHDGNVLEEICADERMGWTIIEPMHKL